MDNLGVGPSKAGSSHAGQRISPRPLDNAPQSFIHSSQSIPGNSLTCFCESLSYLCYGFFIATIGTLIVRFPC